MFFWDKIIESICDFFTGMFYGVREVVAAILAMILIPTTFGFLIGVCLFIKNIIQWNLEHINFINTRYFSSMCVLLASHIIIYTLYVIVDPD